MCQPTLFCRYTTLDDVLDKHEGFVDDAVTIVANVAYSRAVVHDAVERLRVQEPWASDPIVSKLGKGTKARTTFTAPTVSTGYITRLLSRLRLRRRRVTATVKTRPTDDEIRVHQAMLAARMEGTRVPPAGRVSGDETAVCWGIKPKYQFVPADAGGGSGGRGTAPDSNEKER